MARNGVLRASARDSRTGGASFDLRVRVVRVLFMIAWALFARWTPPPLRGWRRMLLRAFGAKMGRGSSVYASAKIWYPAHLVMADYSSMGPRVRCYNQGRITIGEWAIVSQDASLCASSHDFDDPDFQLIIRPIHIGAHAWIAAEAFVGPGVTVGDHAVLGARAVAMRDLDANMVYGATAPTAIRLRNQ
jgi:putative colanic acid biosynthesis acetyltransferase WcaF